MTLDRQTLTDTVITLLRAIAPEVESGTLSPAQPLRQQVDLDSMDWLNFLVSLHERFGVNIPEADYARLVSLNDVLDYLQARLA
jgi:acyl carrier protein